MTMPTFPTNTIQADVALRLLADLYARRFQGRAPSHSDRIRLARWHAYELVRNVLYQAHNQPAALQQLDELAHHVEEEHAGQEEETTAWQMVVLEARALVAKLIEAGGSAQTLIAGETDGFRHLCRQCAQDESNFQRVRFFNQHARRPLLIPEVGHSGPRSLYARCQVCLQALAPVKYVVLVPAGTTRHGKGCPCHHCNQAGVAFVVCLYASDPVTHAFRLPALSQFEAPSREQAKKRALEACWQQGWYLLFGEPA
jgi:hypothetical protein